MPTPAAVRDEMRPRCSVSAPRLLAGLRPDGAPVDLQDHRAAYPVPLRARGGRLHEGIIEAVEASGLTGRGGGGFPTFRKMRSVAGEGGRPVVLVNGTEGEPASGKDSVLLSRVPHLVLDGALWAAAAVGADRIVVGVDRSDAAATRSVVAALAQRRVEAAGASIELSMTPHRYVAGEESALVQFVTKGVAKPTGGASRPFQRGVDGRPTLVQNVETLAHVAQIAARGPDWFRQEGTAEEPGTALYTVSGAVARPGIVEVPIGTSTTDIIAMAGGPTMALQAALVGGFYGTWLPSAALHGSHSRAGLAPHGVSPGCGVVIALPAGACGLAETCRIVGWYSGESAGQCGPCVHGLAALSSASGVLADGRMRNGGDLRSGDGLVAEIRRLGSLIEGRGGCRHPDGAVRLLRSAFAVFAADLQAHCAGRPCPGALAPPVITVPRSQEGWR